MTSPVAGGRNAMDRYTDGTYRAQVPDWHDADAPQKAASILTLLADLDWSAGRVGEVGCGAGGVLTHVCAALDADGQGVDPSADALAGAAPNPRVRFEVGDVSALQPCDLALGIDVVEHVADDIGLVRTLGELAPRVILRIPLDVSALDAVRPGRMLAARDTWGHRHVYTLDLALALVRDAGLNVVAYRTDRVKVRPDTRRAAISDGARRLLHFLAPETTTRLLGGYSLLIACTP